MSYSEKYCTTSDNDKFMNAILDVKEKKKKLQH